MKKYLVILLLFPSTSWAQFPVGSWKLHHSYVSQGEYRTAGYDSVLHTAYNTINISPQVFTGSAFGYVQQVFGGPHDCAETDTLGDVAFSGSNEFGQDGFGNKTGTSAQGMQIVSTDSTGATLPPIVEVVMTGNNSVSNTYYLCNFILGSVASGGDVWGSGSLQNGMRGNGISSNVDTVHTKFVQVVMPNADTITKIAGIYGMIAISTKDSIICWGSSFGGTPKYIHLPTGWKAYDIAGNGIAYWALADSSGTKGVYSWAPIFTSEPAYQGQGTGGTSHTSPTRVDKNNFVKGMMVGGDYPRFVTCDNEATHFVTVQGRLWSIGGNSVGEIGNGKQLNFATYTFSPAPTGGTPSPYSWDQGLNENNQDTIYNVAPGTTDWDTVYCGISNAWSVCGRRTNGVFYQWGRNKGAQIWNGQIDCDYTNGNVRATYPDFLNQPYPVQINRAGLGVTLQQSFCPTCIASPSGFPCNLCTYTLPATPTASAGSTQNLSSGTTTATLSGTGTPGSGGFINYYKWTQTTGPACNMWFPGIGTNPISGLQSGQTYTFLLTVTDNANQSGTSSVTINVASTITSIGPIPAGSKRVTH